MILLARGGSTVNTVSPVTSFDRDHRGVRGLSVRTSTERTTNAFTTALGRVMAPPQATSAQGRTRVGLGAHNAAVNAANENILTDKTLGVRTSNGIFNVHPGDTGGGV